MKYLKRAENVAIETVFIFIFSEKSKFWHFWAIEGSKIAKFRYLLKNEYEYGFNGYVFSSFQIFHSFSWLYVKKWLYQTHDILKNSIFGILFPKLGKKNPKKYFWEKISKTWIFFPKPGTFYDCLSQKMPSLFGKNVFTFEVGSP